MSYSPPLDVFSYFLGLRGSNGLSTLLRTALLGAVALLGFLLSERKRFYFWFYGIVGVFWLAHMANCWRLGYISPVQDTGSLLRLLNFPIFSMTFITILRGRPHLRKMVYLGTGIAFGEIVLFTALPWVLGQPVYTYADLFVGMLGWFSVPSAQSAILVLSTPLAVFAAYQIRKYPVYLLGVFLTTALLFVTGTKLNFYSIFIIIAAYIFLFVLGLGAKKSLRYTLPLLVMLVLTIVFRSESPMAVRQSMTEYSQNIYNSMISAKVEETEDIDETIPEGDGEDIVYERLLTERFLEFMRLKVRGIYYDNGVYGWRTQDLNQRFGMYNVIDAYDYADAPGILSDSRIMKQNYARMVWLEQDFATRLLGFEYSEFFLNGNIYDLENDFPGVFYNVGYLGFALYIAFIGIFFWRVIAALAGDIQERLQKAEPGFKRRLGAVGWGIQSFLSIEMGAVGISFLLAVIAAQISGNVLRRPNVTIYFALAAACLFGLTGERPWFKLKKSPSKKQHNDTSS